MADTEVWKSVVGYEGLYEVSNLGRVKSSTRVLSQAKSKRTGYVSVCLSKNGKHKMYLVHRLVAIAFIPNEQEYPQINHKDENKANNRADNLEWCTAKYNNNYGTVKDRISKKNKISKCKPVVQLRNGTIIAYFPSSISAKHIADPGHIGKCCNGIRKTAGGYQWAFA